MVEIPKLPARKCDILRVPYAVFAYHTVLGFPVPIPDVDVLFKTVLGFTPKKTGLGGLAEECFIPPPHISAYVRKAGLDFGMGLGPGEPDKTPWTEVGSSWATGSPKLFRAKAKIGCDKITFSPIYTDLYNFDPRVPTNIPRIKVNPVDLSTPAGRFTVKPGILEDGRQYFPKFVFYLGGIKIAEGNISQESGGIEQHLKQIKDLLIDFPRIKDLLGKEVELKVEIYAGECKYTGTKTVSLPALEVERPIVKICERWNTIAKPSIPSILKTPFEIRIGDANWICLDTGKMTPIDAIAEVSVNGSRFNLPIRKGSGRLSLGDYEISNILKGITIKAAERIPEVTPPRKLKEEEFEAMARKEGRLGTTAGYIVPLREVQVFLKGRAIVEPQPPGSSWYGAYKIIRPNGTYFWATTWQDIERWL